MTMESTGNSRTFEANCWTSMAASEQGDSSSTEEVESPRSVVAAARRAGGRWRRWRKSAGNNRIEESKNKNNNNKAYCMHSQVLRIKEEESQIGEDFVGDCDEFVANSYPLDDERIVIWSRSILPASPLGDKKNY